MWMGRRIGLIGRAVGVVATAIPPHGAIRVMVAMMIWVMIVTVIVAAVIVAWMVAWMVMMAAVRRFYRWLWGGHRWRGRRRRLHGRHWWIRRIGKQLGKKASVWNAKPRAWVRAGRCLICTIIALRNIHE